MAAQTRSILTYLTLCMTPHTHGKIARRLPGGPQFCPLAHTKVHLHARITLKLVLSCTSQTLREAIHHLLTLHCVYWGSFLRTTCSCGALPLVITLVRSSALLWCICPLLRAFHNTTRSMEGKRSQHTVETRPLSIFCSLRCAMKETAYREIVLHQVANTHTNTNKYKHITQTHTPWYHTHNTSTRRT